MKKWEIERDIDLYLLLDQLELKLWQERDESERRLCIEEWREFNELARNLVRRQNELLERIGMEREFFEGYEVTGRVLEIVSKIIKGLK